METMANVACIEGAIAHMLENNTNGNEILLRGPVQALSLRRVAVAVAVATNLVHAVRCLNHDLDAALSQRDMRSVLVICAVDLYFTVRPTSRSLCCLWVVGKVRRDLGLSQSLILTLSYLVPAAHVISVALPNPTGRVFESSSGLTA